AHYARAGDGSPAVIRIGQLAERVVVALPRLRILRIQNDPHCGGLERATAPRRDGRVPPFDEASTLAFGMTCNSASVTADVRPMTVGFAVRGAHEDSRGKGALPM